MGDENKIYVGGLSMETTSDSLRAHFAHFGEITDCIVMCDKVTGRTRGFGFVTFKDSGVANAALGTSNLVDGREVSCKKAVRENPQNYVQGGTGSGVYNSIKIFVGGLPASCDYEKFTAYFGRFGAIQDAVVMMDSQTQRHRGFGYVTFQDNSAVEAALQNYAANQIDGKWIEVKRCIPQDKMSPGLSFKGGGKGKGAFAASGGGIVDSRGGKSTFAIFGHGGGHGGHSSGHYTALGGPAAAAAAASVGGYGGCAPQSSGIGGVNAYGYGVHPAAGGGSVGYSGAYGVAGSGVGGAYGMGAGAAAVRSGMYSAAIGSDHGAAQGAYRAAMGAGTFNAEQPGYVGYRSAPY